MLRVFFGLDPEDETYRAGSLTPFDLRMALRKHPVDTAIYQDPSPLNWNSLSDLHSVYDINTNMVSNAHANLLNGIFISVEKMSAISPKTLCHGCRSLITAGSLVLNIPGVSHFQKNSKQIIQRVSPFPHPAVDCLNRSLRNNGNFKKLEEHIINFRSNCDYIFILESVWNSLNAQEKSVLRNSELKIAARILRPSLVLPKEKRTGKRGRPSRKPRSEHAATANDRYSQKLPMKPPKTSRAKLPRTQETIEIDIEPLHSSEDEIVLSDSDLRSSESSDSEEMSDSDSHFLNFDVPNDPSCSDTFHDDPNSSEYWYSTF